MLERDVGLCGLEFEVSIFCREYLRGSLQVSFMRRSIFILRLT